MIDPIAYGSPAPVAGDTPVAGACAVDEWRRIEDVLAPIIGREGVREVYAHSVARSRGASPGRPPAAGQRRAARAPGPSDGGPVGGPAIEPQAVDEALHRMFHDVLASLIGASLAARLLAPAWPAEAEGERADHPPRCS